MRFAACHKHLEGNLKGKHVSQISTYNLAIASVKYTYADTYSLYGIQKNMVQ